MGNKLIILRKHLFPEEAVSYQPSAIRQGNYYYSYFAESRKLIAEHIHPETTVYGW
jgi:hypothetical protein